ncbi:hypothetical protein GCM10023168_03300 [Fodinibacter luteus]|uniref:Gram-positive cocci surface proteins LPxTG domain-containing protein n=1 Tax=Fodinibacter luteus TaxID=552064 RepID=A0ABP8JYF1_9MICO
MVDQSQPPTTRSAWPGVALLALAVGFFVLATMLSLADTGASTNWYMWAALAAAAATAVAGIARLIRR